MKTDQEIGEEFADEFSEFCNRMNREPTKHAIAKLLRDHRSIQQNVMRFCVQFIEGMAINGYDLRNEASVTLAKEIMKIDCRALPYI